MHEIIEGIWGGRWELLNVRGSDDDYFQNKRMYTVKSVRTGYVTDMRETSFVR